MKRGAFSRLRRTRSRQISPWRGPSGWLTQLTCTSGGYLHLAYWKSSVIPLLISKSYAMNTSLLFIGYALLERVHSRLAYLGNIADQYEQIYHSVPRG